MIVKVQSSLHSTEKCRQVLVYNKDKSLTYQCDLKKSISDLLNGRPKAFFDADIDCVGRFTINWEVCDQGW